MQEKNMVYKIIAAARDSEENVHQLFKDLMSKLIHLLCDMHM